MSVVAVVSYEVKIKGRVDFKLGDLLIGARVAGSRHCDSDGKQTL